VRRSKKPARVARGTGSGNVSCWAAGDSSEINTSHRNSETHPPALDAARRLVREMLGMGAHFQILRRDGRAYSFTYSAPGSALAACRNIVRDVRDCGGVRHFIQAITEIEQARA
jgi:hypothetical protein